MELKYNAGSFTYQQTVYASRAIRPSVHHYARNLRTTESVFLKLYIMKFYEQFVQPLQFSLRPDNSYVHCS
jgi:hypothetical protein